MASARIHSESASTEDGLDRLRRTGKHQRRERRSGTPTAAPASAPDVHVRFSSHFPLALPAASVSRIPRAPTVMPAPTVVPAEAASGPELQREDENESARAGPGVGRWLVGGGALLGLAAIVLVLWASGATGGPLGPLPASRVSFATTTGAEDIPLPGPAGNGSSAPATSALDRELARGERFEVQAALEIGDLRRAADVAQRAVTHDPSEADSWLLLAAAEIELGHTNAAHHAYRSCRERATRGPRGECVALMQPNGP